ncbi:hypothetical protein JCM33374_g3473 [Metschnikowia sp. JCM 33374]|nr:hypothetical protein JCM33374_g3473 [Metschnikowia sp. JCM 33374]
MSGHVYLQRGKISSIKKKQLSTAYILLEEEIQEDTSLLDFTEGLDEIKQEAQISQRDTRPTHREDLFLVYEIQVLALFDFRDQYMIYRNHESSSRKKNSRSPKVESLR